MGKPKRLRSNPKLPAREIKPTNPPSNLCQWSDLSMQEAMKAVHEGKMSINHAAIEQDKKIVSGAVDLEEDATICPMCS